jgi:WD40 repeat protein
LQHDGTIIDGSFDPTGRFVVTRSGEIGKIYYDDRLGNTAWVWNVKTGKQHLAVRHDAELNVAVFSPKGQFLVTASDDNTAQLWNMKSRKLVHTFKHGGPVTDASFSLDGNQLVTASGETAQLWAVETGKKGRNLGNVQQEVMAARFNPEETLVVTMGYTKPLVWDTATGKIKYTLDHHGAQVASFRATGRYLLTASDDMALVWDLATGKKYSRRPIKHDNLIAASFIEDGLVRTASGHSGQQCALLECRNRRAASSPGLET